MSRKREYIFTNRVNILCGSCSMLGSWFSRMYNTIVKGHSFFDLGILYARGSNSKLRCPQ